MKIRMQGSSIRFRLKQPEVEQFQKQGAITENIQLGSKANEQLSFVLQKTKADNIAVQYGGNTTTIYVPMSLAEEWTETERVGFNAEINLGDGKVLKVLVEKDFKCLDGTEEDNIGSYPNPMKNC